MRWLLAVCLCGLGCGSQAPVIPESSPPDASRILGVAHQLESKQKTKQAMAAYQQVIRLFPNTPEARNALQRITEAQRDAVNRASTRPRK